MSEETHQPYYSKRIRIADIKSPKELVGFKERTIEVTIGNTKTFQTFTNPKDVADVKEEDLKEMLLDCFRVSDEIAKEKGYKFVDQVSVT